MGTKLEPGTFDCYLAAEPDEPMFVLLARDRTAADLVDEWCDRRETNLSGDDLDHERAQIAEARECAAAMRAWRAEHRPPAHEVGAAREGL